MTTIMTIETFKSRACFSIPSPSVVSPPHRLEAWWWWMDLDQQVSAGANMKIWTNIIPVLGSGKPLDTPWKWTWQWKKQAVWKVNLMLENGDVPWPYLFSLGGSLLTILKAERRLNGYGYAFNLVCTKKIEHVNVWPERRYVKVPVRYRNKLKLLDVFDFLLLEDWNNPKRNLYTCQMVISWNENDMKWWKIRNHHQTNPETDTHQKKDWIKKKKNTSLKQKLWTSTNIRWVFACFSHFPRPFFFGGGNKKTTERSFAVWPPEVVTKTGERWGEGAIFAVGDCVGETQG